MCKTFEIEKTSGGVLLENFDSLACTVCFCYCFTCGNIKVSKEYVPPLVQISMEFPLLLNRKTALFLDTKDQCPAQVSTDSVPPSPEEYNNKVTSFTPTLIHITSQTKQCFDLREKQDLKVKPFIHFLIYYNPQLVT